jgi:hypothetical protein
MTEREIKWFVEKIDTAEARGERRQAKSLLLQLLRARFGDSLPLSVLDRVASADTDSLERWAVQTLFASTLEEALS